MSKIGYQIQKERRTCGPVALANALVTRRKSFSLAELKRLVKYNKSSGTLARDLIPAANKLGIKTIRVPVNKLTNEGEFLVRLAAEENGKTWGHWVYVCDGQVFNLDGPQSQFICVKIDWKVKAALVRKVGNLVPMIWRLEDYE